MERRVYMVDKKVECEEAKKRSCEVPTTPAVYNPSHSFMRYISPFLAAPPVPELGH
jgi:hypothetical protein